MAAISKLINVMLGVVLGLTLSNGAIAAVSGGSDCAEGKGGRPDLLKCDQENTPRRRNSEGRRVAR